MIFFYLLLQKNQNFHVWMMKLRFVHSDRYLSSPRSIVRQRDWYSLPLILQLFGLRKNIFFMVFLNELSVFFYGSWFQSDDCCCFFDNIFLISCLATFRKKKSEYGNETNNEEEKKRESIKIHTHNGPIWG